MTAMQKKATTRSPHLSAEDVEQLGRELDAIREQVLASRGERDAAYIRKVIDAQRRIELSSRGVLLFSLFPPAWLLGTVGPVDLQDPGEHGDRPQTSCTAVGLDARPEGALAPAGSGTTPPRRHVEALAQPDPPHVHQRARPRQRPRLRDHARRRGPALEPVLLGQPLYNFVNMLIFEYGIAGVRPGDRQGRQGPQGQGAVQEAGWRVLGKIKKQATRDYVVHPLLSGPSALTTLAANVTANVARNVLDALGHHVRPLPRRRRDLREDLHRGRDPRQWYLRQMLGAANIEGGELMHLMTGNLSFQVEHHLYPDLPSNRYKEIAPKIQELFERNGLNYVTGSFPRQLGSAWKKVFRLALPNSAARSSVAALNPLRGKQSTEDTAAVAA
jgi:linoleoyl-CoA desaturase